jgi:hypothetical protein
MLPPMMISRFVNLNVCFHNEISGRGEPKRKLLHYAVSHESLQAIRLGISRLPIFTSLASVA